MNATIVSKPAQARCHKCGNPEITGICHHCGRSMCKEHANNALPVRLGFWNALLVNFGFKQLTDPEFAAHEMGFARLSLRDEILASLGLAKIVNPEYGGFIFESPPKPDAGAFEQMGYSWQRFRRKLALYWGAPVKEPIAVQVHCEICTHYVPRYPALTWIGLLLSLTLIGAIIGIPLLILGIWLNSNAYIQGQARQLPNIPIEASLGKTEARENLTGRIILDPSGKYNTVSGPINGKINIPLRFGAKAFDLFRAYRVKAGDLQVHDVSNKLLDSGYLVMGPANWEFTQGEIWSSGTMNVIALRSNQQTGPLYGLLTNPDQQEARWDIPYTYRVPEVISKHGKTRNPLPIHVVVSLQPESNRQALSIEIETDAWVAKGSLIERMELWIPNSLGRIERIEPEGRIEDNPGSRSNLQGECMRISWKRLPFDSKRSENPRIPIYIQFQNPIDPDVRLEGEIELMIPMAFSGASGIQFYSPWGTQRNEPVEFSATTALHVALDLDLSGLRYQTLKMLENKIVRQGVVPESKLIADMANAISKEGFYVKRITENPARTSKEGAHKINRYWDVSGRKYEGVYPVDFHLVLTGEEEVGGKGGYRVGQLQTVVSVQGAVTDEKMETLVKNVSEQLCYLIQNSLDQIPAAASPHHEAPEIVAPPPTAPVKTPEPAVVTIPTVAPQPIVETPQPVAAQDNASAVKNLQHKIELVEERLLEGKISEELYYELKSRYENELWELTGGSLGQPAGNTTPKKRAKK